MQSPHTSSRLASSSSVDVDSFLSWIAAPTTGETSKSKKDYHKTSSRQTTSPSSSASSSTSSSTTSSPSPSRYGNETSATSRAPEPTSSGNTYILADSNRLRELSRSPLEEMGLPLFASAAAAAVNIGRPTMSAPKASTSSSTSGSKKSNKHHHRNAELSPSGAQVKPVNA